jgi:hypothetical protein
MRQQIRGVVSSCMNRLKCDVMLVTTVDLLFNKANVKNRLPLCRHFFIFSHDALSQTSQLDTENIR